MFCDLAIMFYDCRTTKNVVWFIQKIVCEFVPWIYIVVHLDFYIEKHTPWYYYY